MSAHRAEPRGPRWDASVTYGFRSFARTEHGHVFAPTATAAIAQIRGAYPHTVQVSVRRRRRRWFR